jgi:phosphatidylglycerol:prolipoprotein diacylglycerol transferase
MCPVWVAETIGGTIAFQMYGMMHVLAVLTGAALAVWGLRHQALPLHRAMPTLLVMGLALVIGARGIHFVLHGELYADNPGRLYDLSWRGFSLFGGLLLGLPVGFGMARWLAVDFWRLCDAATPALGVGLALARVGCFLAGCCYGLSTDLPWGVVFPPGSPAHLHQVLSSPSLFPPGPLPVHPTQLYEAAAALSGAGLAALLFARRAGPGVACATFALWFTAARWGIFHLRPQPESDGLMPFFQPALYALTLLVSGGFLFRRICFARPSGECAAVGRGGNRRSAA